MASVFHSDPVAAAEAARLYSVRENVVQKLSRLKPELINAESILTVKELFKDILELSEEYGLGMTNFLEQNHDFEERIILLFKADLDQLLNSVDDLEDKVCDKIYKLEAIIAKNIQVIHEEEVAKRLHYRHMRINNKKVKKDSISNDNSTHNTKPPEDILEEAAVDDVEDKVCREVHGCDTVHPLSDVKLGANIHGQTAVQQLQVLSSKLTTTHLAVVEASVKMNTLPDLSLSFAQKVLTTRVARQLLTTRADQFQLLCHLDLQGGGLEQLLIQDKEVGAQEDAGYLAYTYCDGSKDQLQVADQSDEGCFAYIKETCHLQDFHPLHAHNQGHLLPYVADTMLIQGEQMETILEEVTNSKTAQDNLIVLPHSFNTMLLNYTVHLHEVQPELVHELGHLLADSCSKPLISLIHRGGSMITFSEAIPNIVVSELSPKFPQFKALQMDTMVQHVTYIQPTLDSLPVFLLLYDSAPPMILMVEPQCLLLQLLVWDFHPLDGGFTRFSTVRLITSSGFSLV